MAGRREAEHGALLWQAFDPEPVAGVWASDGQAQALGQFGRTVCVIDVGVGESDRFQV